jgi:hypothetical protein
MKEEMASISSFMTGSLAAEAREATMKEMQK